MSEALNDASGDRPPQMPEKYTWLRDAASSTYCFVNLCVSTSDIDDARSKLAANAQEDLVVDALLRRVVAVKIPGEGSTQPTMHSELRILQEIHRQSYPRSGGEHCIEVVDHYDMEAMAQGEPGWLVMASSPVSSDLEGLFVFDTRDKLPKCLLWLIITQLYETIYFLHRECKPTITHGSVLAEDILISFPYEEKKNGEVTIAKRPKISLVGFAKSCIHDPTDSPDGLERKARAEEEDVECLAQLIRKLIDRCYEHENVYDGKPGGKMTRLVRTYLKDDAPEEVRKFMQRDARDLEGVWAAIGVFAKEKLGKVSDEEWEEVRNSVDEVAEGEVKLSDLVKGVLSDQSAKN
ncbi:hypothetical protein J4E93_009033 [Alternaria ventricosa]|uniref:uncharacterized protein n=1 Tax=Alternaria ventricosa TaxID=1187951 RepID=UPI0020C1E5E6|nr:uncharacterized protein J4E93_009033 [Alternaria ventricosa]KAI4639679.1 hypothetical protein J4E93_009033 [Alternaria ventricosa]